MNDERDPGLRKAASGRPVVRRATAPRYGRQVDLARASDSDDPAYRRVDRAVALEAALSDSGRRNPVFATVSALPFLMLILGIAWFYLGERAQTGGAPIATESRAHVGTYAGVSRVTSGGGGRHYLWFEERGERRNVRLRAEQVPMVREALAIDAAIALDAAPTVAGSETHWVVWLESEGRTILDERATLR